MKRALLGVSVVAVATVLGGCPVYSGSDYRVCDGQTCYDCPDPSYSGMCIPWSCSTDADCAGGYSCATSGQCTAGAPPAPSADCSTTGCAAGEVCLLSGGVAQCVP